MAQTAYIATVQIVITPNATIGLDSEAAACDWFSGLLSDNAEVLDWQYLRIGGQLLLPQETIIPDPYEEGDAFA